MNLGELIDFLEHQDPNFIVKKGFHEPHSYRGYYEQLAFEPCDNISCKEMLEAAKEALDKTYEGYKGGDFKMTQYTEVWIANYGDCGDGISHLLLEYMFNLV